MQDMWVGGGKGAGSGRTSSRSLGSRDGRGHLDRGQAARRVQLREARCAGDGPPGEGVEAQRGQVCPLTAQQDGKLNRASSVSPPWCSCLISLHLDRLSPWELVGTAFPGHKPLALRATALRAELCFYLQWNFDSSTTLSRHLAMGWVHLTGHPETGTPWAGSLCFEVSHGDAGVDRLSSCPRMFGSSLVSLATPESPSLPQMVYRFRDGPGTQTWPQMHPCTLMGSRFYLLSFWSSGQV